MVTEKIQYTFIRNFTLVNMASTGINNRQFYVYAFSICSLSHWLIVIIPSLYILFCVFDLKVKSDHNSCFIWILYYIHVNIFLSRKYAHSAFTSRYGTFFGINTSVSNNAGVLHDDISILISLSDRNQPHAATIRCQSVSLGQRDICYHFLPLSE